MLWTSTIGVSPVTVIVSSSDPILSSALIVAMNASGSSMPSRLKVLNPVSWNVTAVDAGTQVDEAILAGRRR